jgi:helix-turn-helix protein
MGLSRSTYYDQPAGQSIEEARLIKRVKEICAEWPCFGYRRVTAQLHAEGILVNHKKVMRLMREHGLTVDERDGLVEQRPPSPGAIRREVRMPDRHAAEEDEPIRR